MRKFDFLILNKQSLQVGVMSAECMSKSKISEAVFLSILQSWRQQTRAEGDSSDVFVLTISEES